MSETELFREALIETWRVGRHCATYALRRQRVGPWLPALLPQGEYRIRARAAERSVDRCPGKLRAELIGGREGFCEMRPAVGRARLPGGSRPSARTVGATRRLLLRNWVLVGAVRRSQRIEVHDQWPVILSELAGAAVENVEPQSEGVRDVSGQQTRASGVAITEL